MQGCQSYLCDVRPEGVVAIVKVMERVVHLYPSHFPQLIQPVLPTVLRNLLEEEVGLQWPFAFEGTSLTLFHIG